LVVSEKTVGDSQKFFACSEKKTDQTAQQ
jgi:hypothetical protein